MQEAESQMGMSGRAVKSAVKGVISMIFSILKIHPPQAVDTLDFTIALIAKVAMDALEKQPIELHAEEVSVK